VEKYGTAKQTTDENIIPRVRIAYWINKSTNTNTEYVKLTDFPRCYILPTLSCYLTKKYSFP